MSDNIIDSRERFKARAQANSSENGDRLEGVILARSRLSGADKARFAENLGKLAAKIDPANPLSGAQKMVSTSGLEGVWEKRKRYFRLPGEAAPASSKDGEYGSRPRTFVSLAQAAAPWLVGSNREELLTAERRRTVRALAEGTSFLPTFMPSDPADRTAKSLLDHFSSALSSAIKERTRIVDLWATLKDSPFGVDALDADEINDVEPSPYGEAGSFPPSLLHPFFREHIIAGRFNPVGGTLGLDTFWANPIVKIGFVAFPVESRVFVLPDEIAVGIHPDNETEEGYITDEARDWLESIGCENGSLPEVPFTGERGFGWKPCFLSVMRSVGLEIVADDDGAPRVQVTTWGDQDDKIGFSFSRNGLSAREIEIARSISNKAQTRDVYFDEFDLLFAVHSHPFESRQSTPKPPVVGLLSSGYESRLHFEDFDSKGWTEDQDSFAILASNKGQFYPTIPESEPINGPVLGGSVGASILQNVRFASKENSMATILIEKARLTADAGLRFRDSLIETYRDAFRHI